MHLVIRVRLREDACPWGLAPIPGWDEGRPCAQSPAGQQSPHPLALAALKAQGCVASVTSVTSATSQDDLLIVGAAHSSTEALPPGDVFPTERADAGGVVPVLRARPSSLISTRKDPSGGEVHGVECVHRSWVPVSAPLG